METVPPFAVDPLPEVPFRITESAAVATAGSCFAQHISGHLRELGFHYLVTEEGPSAMSVADRAARNYGAFSARYGNIYTVRQLVQLFDRAFGVLHPRLTHWEVSPNEFLDPFRPRIQPGGFPSLAALAADREEHLACVRHLFEKLDVLLFTMGLTEAWEYKDDGAVLPLAPGVAGGEWDPARYIFRNYSCAEVVEDLLAFLDRLRSVNPRSRAILTVSPVPLRATFEPRHVLVSTCLSKSILRVAAASCCDARPDVAYFPAYEIVTGPHARGAYYQDDLRSVTESGVNHVMRVFCAHYLDRGRPAVAADSGPADGGPAAHFRSELASLQTIVCDEEALDPGQAAPAGERNRAADGALSTRSSLRIAVMGNCQASGLTSCLQVFQPSARVQSMVLPELSKQFRSVSRLLAEIATYDVVVVLPPVEGFFGDLDLTAVRGAARKIILCPLVTFAAFHPDCIYVERKDTARRVHSPLGDYNSALTLLAWLEGLEVEEALRLFHPAIYARAGYFDAWPASEEALLRAGRDYEFPFDKLYRSWVRRGVFMHTINHPKLFVFADLASEILRRCGIAADSRLAESYIPDELLNNCVWPLYPEIGRPMSLSGSYIFKNGSWLFDLRGFVEESFRFYGSHAKDLIGSSRMDEWRRDSGFMDCVRSRAAAGNGPHP